MIRSSIIVFLLISCCFLSGQKIDTVPIIDLHIHLKGGFTIEDAVKRSKEENIVYGIAVNCGKGFPIQRDEQIDSFINAMKSYPQFYLGMQAEGREWTGMFSKEAVAKFDYVFSDAMTFTDAKGRRNRIWLKNETWIDDEESFMDHYVNTIAGIIGSEPINIYVNPTFLPEQMAGRYDHFWTEERMDKVIRAARKKHVAIEINNRYRIPSEHFIIKAKKAGVKFTIGTNNVDSNFSGAEYAIEMIKKCQLTGSDFYIPEKKNKQ